MQTLRINRHGHRRRGVTLTDILVTITVGLVAVWLFVAYTVHRSRPHGRRFECEFHLRQVALAAQAYALANQGEIPDLTRRHGVPGTAGESVYPWVVDLLPYLDSAAVFRAIQSSSEPPFSVNCPVPCLKILNCPNDVSRSSQLGGLSYVANAGYMREDDWGDNTAHHGLRIDWNRNGSLDEVDLDTARSTGLFWRRDKHPAINGDGGKPVTFDEVAEGDGQTLTMMFSENLQATTWVSSNTSEIAFGIFVTVGSSDRPDPAKFTWPPTRGPSEQLNFETSNFHLANATGSRDATPGSRVGRAPRPSSPHADLVNVAFVDGRVEGINLHIDKRIWAAMLTPNGQRRGQPATPS